MLFCETLGGSDPYIHGFQSSHGRNKRPLFSLVLSGKNRRGDRSVPEITSSVLGIGARARLFSKTFMISRKKKVSPLVEKREDGRGILTI